MLERLITPQLSSQIIDSLLAKEGWTAQKIAKKIHASREYVRRVHRGVQNLEYADVVALAKACRKDPYVFVFEAVQPEKLSAKQRELHQLTRKVIDGHAELERATRPTKRRRRQTRAA